MSDPVQFFDRLFPTLSGISTGAYDWQRELFRSFVKGDFPGDLFVPTGLGKTSVMNIWLLALAWEVSHGQGNRTIPTRLVWVVDRRVVVDQASTEAWRIANLLNAAPRDNELRSALSGLARDTHEIIAVSTLRGELADNREWSRDPLRPAIIVGTVDMIGSRLLFSGYGDSRKRRALHAALLGQDALIINDEAHLTPAFAELLAALREHTQSGRPLRTMLASATPRGNALSCFPPTFDADFKNDQFQKRFCAIKRLHIIENEKPKKEIQKRAAEPDRRTIVFVRSPEDARQVAKFIESKHRDAHVPVIAGTQRGWERDRLLDDPVVKHYLSKESPGQEDGPSWMVATSAGEVGIDISSDRVITDLETADHLLQRFGRLNRFGETEGDVFVIYSATQIGGDKNKRLRATLEYLNGLRNVSLATLHQKSPPQEALSAPPLVAPLLPWHIDVWSMTSFSTRDWPSRPPVEYWLRGEDDEGTPPETYVAWRADARDLADPDVPDVDRENVFEVFPVVAQERLKQPSNALRESLEKSAYLEVPAILIGRDGEINTGLLATLIEDEERLHYATLVLPPGTGYLDRNGMVDWARSTADLSLKQIENYDQSRTGNRERFRISGDDPEVKSRFRLRYTVEIASEEEGLPETRWLYFVDPLWKRPPQDEELLKVHCENVARLAADVANRAALGESITRVFEWAGRLHDEGKNRQIWQWAAGNQNLSRPLAKTVRLKGRALAGYRHELGSLIDAESELPSDFSDEERDLALHLVAAHHGWGRPHFPEKAFDRTKYRRSERAALEGARRFGRLQKQYGPWLLAYLESLFQSADAIASANSPETVDG